MADNPLLAAVEALTKPIRTRTVQDVIERWTFTDDDGQDHEREKVIGTQTVTITHRSLLDQFRDAVIPSTNTATGSSSLASMRNMLDSTALMEYAKIAAQTADWCRLVGAEATRGDASTNLTRWHARWVGANGDPDADIWYVQQLRGWASLIRAHLDPPRRRTLFFPCPICGNTTWSDGEEGGTWPLELLYRVGDDDEPVVVSAVCKACKPVTTWPTPEAARELLEELDARHAIVKVAETG